MFRKLKFSTKLLLSILSVVTISSIISTYFVSSNAFESTHKAASNDIKNIAKIHSYEIKKEIQESITLTKGLANSIESMIQAQRFSKNSIIHAMEMSLKKDAYILGVFAQVDKELFGMQRDFTPYLLKKNGSVMLSIGSKNQKPQEFINTLKRTKKEFISDPYYFNIDGKKTLILTILTPIFEDGKFIGTIGFDVSLKQISKEISKIKIGKEGYAFLISQEGTVLGHPQSKIINKKVPQVTKDRDIVVMPEKIKQQKDHSFTNKSLKTGLTSYYYMYPFEIGDTDVNWGVVVTVSQDEYLQAPKKIMWFSIIASILGFLIIAIVVFINTKILSKNLNAITEGLNSFFAYLNKESNKTSHIDIRSQDEFGVMAKGINSNIDKIEAGLNRDIVCVKEVLELVQRVKEGKLDKKLSAQASNPELIQLSSNFNEMIQILQDKIGKDLIKISQVLKEFSIYNFTAKIENPKAEIELNVNHLGEEISNVLGKSLKVGLTLEESSKQLLTNVDTLNISSNETATSLEETAAALEEITSTIVNNTQNITKMNSVTKEVTSSATKGQELAHNTTVAMEEITQQVTFINEAIAVIDQIAFQTNILSLNAAVEAATAGEAGKGFAVVAGEVRNLASRSAEAAKEIKELVETATTKANEGKEISSEMIKGYKELLSNINESTIMIEEISKASQEQQTGITQINDAITSLDSQTQENANIANQTQDIASQTDEIAKEIVKDTNSKEFLGKQNLI